MTCPSCKKEHCIWIKTRYLDETKLEGCKYCWEEEVNVNFLTPQMEWDGKETFKISPAHRRHIENTFLAPDCEVVRRGTKIIGMVH